jgi:hypothetical protein
MGWFYYIVVPHWCDFEKIKYLIIYGCLELPPFLDYVLRMSLRVHRSEMADSMKSAEKIRILVLGDSGVGKTSLVELVCTGEELRRWV